MKRKSKRTIALYGVGRNGAPVLMFFSKRKHLREFVADWPGTYETLVLKGVDYDDFEISFGQAEYHFNAPCEDEQVSRGAIGRLERFIASDGDTEVLLEGLDEITPQSLKALEYPRVVSVTMVPVLPPCAYVVVETEAGLLANVFVPPAIVDESTVYAHTHDDFDEALRDSLEVYALNTVEWGQPA